MQKGTPDLTCWTPARNVLFAREGGTDTKPLDQSAKLGRFPQVDLKDSDSRIDTPEQGEFDTENQNL